MGSFRIIEASGWKDSERLHTSECAGAEAPSEARLRPARSPPCRTRRRPRGCSSWYFSIAACVACLQLLAALNCVGGTTSARRQGAPLDSWGNASAEDTVDAGDIQDVKHADYDITTISIFYRGFTMTAFGD